MHLRSRFDRLTPRPFSCFTAFSQLQLGVGEGLEWHTVGTFLVLLIDDSLFRRFGLFAVVFCVMNYGCLFRPSLGLRLGGQGPDSIGSPDGSVDSAGRVAGPVLRAALLERVLPNHCGALIRILTLSKTMVSPAHLQRSNETPVQTTFAMLALQCLGLLAAWFPPQSPGTNDTDRNFADALLSTLARGPPDKSCARLMSALTSNIPTTATNGETDVGEDRAKSVARELALGVLLILHAALSNARVLARWAPQLSKVNFFKLLRGGLQQVEPMLRSRNGSVGTLGRSARLDASVDALLFDMRAIVARNDNHRHHFADDTRSVGADEII